MIKWRFWKSDAPLETSPAGFLHACSSYDFDAANQIIDAGLPIDALTERGETLLEIALRHRNEPLAIKLAACGADPWRPTTVIDDAGRMLRMPPFETSIAKGFVNFASTCLSLFGSPSLVDREARWIREYEPLCNSAIRVWRLKSSYLHLACASKSNLMFKFLLDNNCSLKFDPACLSPLLACCILDAGVNCAIELLLAGFDPRSADSSGFSPLSKYPELLSIQANLERSDILCACPSFVKKNNTSLRI